MEIPVMTSASTHGLRSACTKPNTSYLTSSNYSGGCLKKIIDTVKKSDGSALLNDVSLTKKRKASTDGGVLYKKEKSLDSKVCPTQYLSTKQRNGKIKTVHGGSYAEEKYSKAFLNSFPKSVSGEIFSKIKSKNFFDNEINGIVSEISVNSKAKSNSKCKESKESSMKCQVPASATLVSGDVHENSNNEESKKNYGLDFCAINAKTLNVSISDIDLKREDCVKSELMIVSDEGEKTEELEIGGNDGKLTEESKHSISRGTSQNSRNIIPPQQSSKTLAFVPDSQVFRTELQSPSKSQVQKTVECAGRGVSREENLQFIAESGYTPTFHDAGLTVLSTPVSDTRIEWAANLLNPCWQRDRISRATPTSKEFGKNGGNHQNARRTGKSSKSMCRYDVFLGGSCNPTTWRTDIAIPNLKKMGITYFNPQVSQWKPELMEDEYHAKENAEIMFFVIDNQTRGVSALIEVAHIAGSKRNLILVIQSYTQEKQMICGEVISQEEYEDLRDGQQVLQDLVESQGIPVFDNIRIALKRTEKLLGKGSESDEDVNENEASRVAPPPKRIEVREAFRAVDTSESGKISLMDACLAFQLLTQRKMSPSQKKCAGRMFGMGEEDVTHQERTISLEEFQSVVCALTTAQESEEPFQGSGTLLAKISDDSFPSYTRDIFLGGTHKDTCWKKDIAIPLLKKHGLSYFNPSVSECSERFSPIEAAAMNASYILLFVITNSARSIAEMAVAGHYIGLGAKMVLCIQQLSEERTVGPDKLTENAVKDYNRGRLYLADIAKRNGVKIFNRIPEAVECAIEECKQR